MRNFARQVRMVIVDLGEKMLNGLGCLTLAAQQCRIDQCRLARLRVDIALRMVWPSGSHLWIFVWT